MSWYVHIPHDSESDMSPCFSPLTLYWRTGNLGFISIMFLNFSKDSRNSTDIYYCFLFEFFPSFIKMYSSLIQYILTAGYLPLMLEVPPHLLVTFPFPIHCFSIHLLKSIGVPKTATENSVTKCNKTSHNPSYQGWMWQPSRRKWFPRSGKTVKDRPTEEKNKNIHIINNISDVIKRVKN